ncbi:winged helix-turn-helix domain-containing protein [Micromonospora sp. NBC_01739]|uniref:winged helix-turn-helix domain-containing protein n=1 Tax=Micromonospora sp. NBC_01739 TaxID=2975985 RepID=UPI002E1204C1|nr:transcriptional regulator [Micromonospora sp. NBC_01739]
MTEPPSGTPATGSAPHPATALDDVVHQRVRLGILTVLSEATECRFATLRDELGLTDGNLNRHLRILEQAGLLQSTKGYEGRRPVTWLRLTRAGRTALRAEVAALEQLVSRIRTATATDEES